MPISFSSIPSTTRVPFVAAEFNSSNAQQGASLMSYRALLMGQKTSAGTATDNSIHRVLSASDVQTLAGRGSMLHRMALAWFSVNKSTELWILAVPDNSSGVQAAGAVAITGPATAAGTLSVYLGGQLVQVAVTASQTADAIGTALAAAINANLDLPVTAVNTSGTVAITYRHKGAVGNEFDIRVNYQAPGEALPAGVSVAITAMTSGASNPVLTSAIAAMGDIWFHLVAHPYTDATSLTALENEFASRAAPMRMIDGVLLTAKLDTAVNLLALGASRNSESSCILPATGSPTPPSELAAHAAAVLAPAASIDPARPTQTLRLPWVKAPVLADQLTTAVQEQLLHSGIGTLQYGADGSVALGRVVTTYQHSAAGAADTAYLDVTTRFSLMYARWSWRNRMLAKYPRHKLANDGVAYAAGQNIMTPSLGRAEALSWFSDLVQLGIFEDLAQFKRDLVVERNAQDPNRLDFYLPPNLVNQLVGVAAEIGFLL